MENGWRGFREINTVDYDPSRVTIKEMEAALKASGTYRGTASGSNAMEEK